MKTDINRMSGCSLIEAVLTLTLSVFLLYTLHTTLQSSISARESTQRNHQIQEMGNDYLAKLRQIPFGTPTDPAPSGSQLSELFDDDQDLGSISLSQVLVQPDHPGHTFGVASDGLIGIWRVRTTNDLDGNQSIDGLREGRPDLMRIEIYFEERLVIEALRASDVALTVTDLNVNYLASL